jgi:hypothetical protein
MTNPTESTFVTVRHRMKVTAGPAPAPRDCQSHSRPLARGERPAPGRARPPRRHVQAHRSRPRAASWGLGIGLDDTQRFGGNGVGPENEHRAPPGHLPLSSGILGLDAGEGEPLPQRGTHRIERVSPGGAPPQHHDRPTVTTSRCFFITSLLRDEPSRAAASSATSRCDLGCAARLDWFADFNLPQNFLLTLPPGARFTLSAWDEMDS